ncbi:hypothetical protein [Pontiella sp.]|uniref:hypothetical protein n=1 Tax=Pontiella sp. TaxID=2837462 RepID=UPI003565BE9E
MPFNIEYDADDDLIVATFTGEVTMPLVKDYLAALLPVLEKTGCRRLLSDSRNAKLNVTAMDILRFPKIADLSPLTATLRRAVLAAPGTSGYELYETLSNAQGQNVRLFPSRAEAMKWLLAEGE